MFAALTSDEAATVFVVLALIGFGVAVWLAVKQQFVAAVITALIVVLALVALD